MPYADIILLALIAGFILLRLRSVLGQKTGHENPNFFNRVTPAEKTIEAPVVHVSEKSLKPKPAEEPDPYLAALGDKTVVATLESIKAKDPIFTATSFLDGAKMAFEMILDAFAKNDKATLKMLLSDELYRNFAGEADARAASDRRAETTLVAVTSKSIASATLTGNTARIAVDYLSEQINLVRDREGKIVEGDPSEIHHVEDQWVFERDVTSKNPNWKIIET